MLYNCRHLWTSTMIQWQTYWEVSGHSPADRQHQGRVRSLYWISWADYQQLCLFTQSSTDCTDMAFPRLSWPFQIEANDGVSIILIPLVSNLKHSPRYRSFHISLSDRAVQFLQALFPLSYSLKFRYVQSHCIKPFKIFFFTILPEEINSLISQKNVWWSKW